MEKSNLILKSTISSVRDCFVDVYCDGNSLISLKCGEVVKLSVDPGQHLLEFKTLVNWGGDFFEHDFLECNKVVDLPSGQQFVLIEEELMAQYEELKEKRQSVPSADEIMSDISSVMREYFNKKQI